MHLDNKVVLHYADASQGERCAVYLIELYCSKLLDAVKAKDLFCCEPKSKFNKEDECWYYHIPVGLNVLSRKLTLISILDSSSVVCQLII